MVKVIGVSRAANNAAVSREAGIKDKLSLIESME
jgi:hypothetical protein